LEQLVTNTLDHMIDDELIARAAIAAKLESSDEEIDAAIEEIEKSNDLDFEWLTAAIQAQGYTIETYRRELGRSLSRLRAIDRFVAPHVHVSDEDVLVFYSELARRGGTPLPSFEHMKRDLREELSRREMAVQTARWVEQLRRKATVILEP
jgi:hypothetical protein